MFTTIVSFVRGFMLRHPALMLIVILALAWAVTLDVEQHRLRALRVENTALSLAASNVAAERDSTRDVAKADRHVAELLGDSVRAVERRAVQVTQRRDELDRALGGERRARVALGVMVDSLERTVPAVSGAGAAAGAADTAITTAGSGHSVRRATFALREAPYTVRAEVEVPDPPDTARLMLKVALDSIPMAVRMMCAAPDGHGVRSASVVVTSPPWANVRLDRVEQAADVCASPALAAARAGPVGWAGRSAPARIAFQRILVGVGVVGRSRSSASLGWFVGTGFAIGI